MSTFVSQDQHQHPEPSTEVPAGASPASSLGPGVQLKDDPGIASSPAASSVMSHWADDGVRDAGAALPHLPAIQHSFGKGHDLSGIESHTGGSAAKAAGQMGAQAYAAGNHVAFASQPDLHLAAHEAAHVVQQRAGVQLKGGVGEAGDDYERNADAVADRVVAGKSAADLLPQGDDIKYHGPVQRKSVQLRMNPHGHVDADKLDKEGHDAHLEAGKAQAAVTANNRRWTGKYRSQLIHFLRGAEVAETEGFSESDVQHAARLQAGAGAGVDGIIGDGTMSVLLAAGFKFSDDVNKDRAHPQGKLSASEVVIEFWPGELEDQKAWDQSIAKAEKDSADAGDGAPFRHLDAPEGEGRLYIKVGGKLVASYRARGGPPRKIKDFGGHTADPTQGSYTLGKNQSDFTTSSWQNSQIPWGAHIRQGTGGFEYQRVGSSKWLADPGAVDASVFSTLPKVPGQTGDIRWWNQNDFGAMATRLQGSPGFYLHTGPETEEASALGKEIELSHSHGCVHLDPKQRDEMIARGYMQPGVRFVCKKYDQQLLPQKARDGMMGK